MSHKVSVCIPTYNRKVYLKETIESILNQTYKDFEIVVVDDGSTDGTEQMLKDAGYPLRYYWQENAGDAAARNRLIELSEGKFITFLDSDDLLVPDAIERMLNIMEAENGEVIVYGPYFRIDQNGNVYGRCRRKLHSGYIASHLFQNILVHSCGSMLPKKVLEAAGGFDQSLKVCSDYDLWLKLSLKYRFIALKEPTFKRRRHRGNLSKGSAETRIKELQVLERFFNEKGEEKIIPEKIAMRRLSKEQYLVGKCFLKEENLGEAFRYFRASFNRHPNPKALLMWGLLSLKQKLHRVSGKENQ